MYSPQQVFVRFPDEPAYPLEPYLSHKTSRYAWGRVPPLLRHETVLMVRCYGQGPRMSGTICQLVRVSARRGQDF